MYLTVADADVSSRKSHKRRNKSLDVDESHSDTKEDSRSRRHKRSKENRKLLRENENPDASPSPVRLSSFLQRSSDKIDRQSS